MEVETGNEVSACNRLLFIENLKLLAKKEEALNEMMIEAQEFLRVVGLELNLKSLLQMPRYVRTTLNSHNHTRDLST